MSKVIPITLFLGFITVVLILSSSDDVSVPKTRNDSFSEAESRGGELEELGEQRTRVVRSRGSQVEEIDETAPDASPSIEEQIRAARGVFFNFSCACCGDHLKYLKILEEEGLAWPRIWDGLSDPIAFHNLKFREEQAIMRILKDPHGAVEFMEAQISFEREKLTVRQARAPWDESRKEGDAGDFGLFGQMMDELPPKYFEAIVTENLEVIAVSSEHRDEVVRLSQERDVEIRLRVFARLADAEVLGHCRGGGEAMEELERIVPSSPDDPNFSFYDEVIRRSERAVAQADLSPNTDNNKK